THTGRRPRPHDARVPDVELAPTDGRQHRPAPGAAVAELVGLHGDVDTGRATLQAAWQTSPLAPFPTSSRPGWPASSAGSTRAGCPRRRRRTSPTRAT